MAKSPYAEHLQPLKTNHHCAVDKKSELYCSGSWCLYGNWWCYQVFPPQPETNHLGVNYLTTSNINSPNSKHKLASIFCSAVSYECRGRSCVSAVPIPSPWFTWRCSLSHLHSSSFVFYCTSVAAKGSALLMGLIWERCEYCCIGRAAEANFLFPFVWIHHLSLRTVVSCQYEYVLRI